MTRFADDLADGSGADRRELASEVFGQRGREAFDLFGRPGELRPEVLPLRGDARGTRVEVALSGHVAAQRDERRGAERVFLGAEQRREEEVAAGLEAAVRSERDAIAEVVAEQDLVDLGEAQLPRRASVLDRAERRRAGSARVARQVYVARSGLDDARGDRADAPTGDELYADPGRRVYRPQIRN